MTHHQTLLSILDAVSRGDVDEMMSFYDEGAVISFPYSATVQKIEGKKAISDYLGGALKLFQMTMRLTEVIQSTDDDVIVATYSSKGVVTTTKKAYENRYVGIFTFRNGRVLSQVEYYNPLLALSALTP